MPIASTTISASDILRHSLAWVRGEFLEMGLITGAALIMVACGAAFARLGGTPLAKAVVIPLIVLGVFFGAIGASGLVSNQRRLSAYEQAAQQDPVAFAQAEQARVEGFQYMYVITNVLAPLCFAAASAIFWLTYAPRPRGVAIALVIFGLFGFLIDGFSKERADEYHARVTELLTR